MFDMMRVAAFGQVASKMNGTELAFLTCCRM